jgi:serine/threonine-protein kinase
MQQKQRPILGSEDSDAPLSLGSDAGQSTHQLDAAASAAATGAGGSAGLEGDSRGKSTGVDTMLGRVFVERGYITSQELDAIREMQRSAGESAEARTLPDLLIEQDYVTRKQLDRVRTEIEAEKSTQQIPGYQILKKLGSGAMATVFLAKQLSLDRLVAIKVLPAKFSKNDKFIERFYKEGRAAAQLNHRNIVGAYDVGQAGEHHYFVMEYVDGDTVYDRILKEKRLPEKESIEIVRQVAEALQHAHSKGFIHRDIKPKNIMISSDGTAKLADLGLARAVTDKEAAEAEAGRAYGTPYYISPEQIRGELSIDGRADIYGLGATFYHMVVGKVPFEGRNPSSVMHKHLKQKLTPPDHANPRVSASTAQVIEMMMNKSRKQRYQTVADLIVDLDRIARGEAPHFAQSSADLTAIAAKVEQKAKAAPLPLHPLELAAPPRVSRWSDPAFLFASGLAALSIIINLVLASLLMADRGAGDEGGVIVPQQPANASRLTEQALVGSWQAGSQDFQGFPGVATLVIDFRADGFLTWTQTPTVGEAIVRDSPWSIKEDVLIITGRTDNVFFYRLEGDTLTISKRGGLEIRLRRSIGG